MSVYVTVVIFIEANCCPLKHEIPGQSKVIPGSLHGRILKISQIPAWTVQAIPGWLATMQSVFLIKISV